MALATTYTTTLTLTNPSSLNNDGMIEVTTDALNPPLQYSIDNIEWQGSGIFTNLSPGTYTIYIQDSVGNTRITEGIQLTVPTLTSSPIIVGLDITHPTSLNNDGEIRVFVSGGVPPYQYYIGITPQSQDIFKDLGEGEYDIRVTDDNGLEGGLTGVSLKSTSYVQQSIAVKVLEETTITI